MNYRSIGSSVLRSEDLRRLTGKASHTDDLAERGAVRAWKVRSSHSHAEINPMIVEGQIHRGIVQGLGEAMMEDFVFDRKTSQPLSPSFSALVDALKPLGIKDVEIPAAPQWVWEAIQTGH